MIHERAEELLLDLAYGELEPGEARAVEAHLAECAACAAQWQRIAGTRRAMAPLGEVPADDGRRAAIVEAARASASRPATRRTRSWTLAATALVLMLVAGITVKLSSGRPIDRVPAAPAAPGAPPGESRDVAPSPSPEAAARRAGDASPDERRGATAPAAAATPQRLAAKPQGTSHEGVASEQPREDTLRDGDSLARKSAAAAPAATPPPAPEPRADAPAAAARVERALGDWSAIAAETDRRAAEGRLTATPSRVVCEGVALEQTSWAEAGRTVKVALRAADGRTVTGWYDEAGRLRAVEALSAARPPLGLRRELAETGAVTREEGSGTAPESALEWLPSRDPDTRTGRGCVRR